MPDPNARRSSLRALKHWNFAVFFTGNLLSNCGTWFQNIALALLLYRLTRSSFWVGAVNFAQFIGVILLAPWAGSLADRIDRRRLIIATQIGATLASAVLAWLIAVGVESRVVILGLTFALGATAAFATPALQAVIPALVPREDLGAAIAMNSVTFNLARALGPGGRRARRRSPRHSVGDRLERAVVCGAGGGHGRDSHRRPAAGAPRAGAAP